MIKFNTTSETPLQLLVDPKAVAYQIAQSDKYDIAEFLCEFAKYVVEMRIKFDQNFQMDIAQYMECLTKKFEDLQNIEHYYGTLTDTIMYRSGFYRRLREDGNK